MSERVSPEALVPPIGRTLWPNMIPCHGVTIVDGIGAEGKPTLHVAFSTGTAPWVLIGMLETVLQDVRMAWEHGAFEYVDDPPEVD